MRGLLVLIFGLLLAIPNTSQAGDIEDMLYPSAKVEVTGGSGSATAIKIDSILGTYLITNYHVVKNSLDKVTVQFYGKLEKHPAYIHSVDVQNDIAVLITRHKHEHIALIGERPNMFDPVYCVGASLGHPIAPSRGVVTGLDVPLFGSRYFTRTDCGIVQGNSGGGMFVYQRGHWRYVGMPSMVAMVGGVFNATPVTFLGVAVRIEDIRWHLYRHGVLQLPPLTRVVSPH